MNIKHTKIAIRDLIKDYEDDEETGRVSGYGGNLDIRPAYQREFVYKDKQREAVIDTVNRGFPLNVIYWAKSKNGTFEVLDGQQRIISICQYCNGDFSVNFRYYHNLNEDEKNRILNYELDVYQCEGEDSEKLEWFKTINIAGEKLTMQELRNAVYSGTWLSDAKRRFSARNCAAERLAKDYLSGAAIRQDYLETALSWISEKEGLRLEDYMARHQHDDNAAPLWTYFTSVIEWVKTVFSNYWKEMKGVQWGLLYNRFRESYPNVKETNARIKELMQDEDVTNKKGIFEYLLSGEEKCLSIRAFSPNQKREAYERQNHKCPFCEAEGVDKEWDIDDMEADHITPWSKGGHTTAENCQMLCKAHNRRKGSV